MTPEPLGIQSTALKIGDRVTCAAKAGHFPPLLLRVNGLCCRARHCRARGTTALRGLRRRSAAMAQPILHGSLGEVLDMIAREQAAS
jgi:hypothetical protein